MNRIRPPLRLVVDNTRPPRPKVATARVNQTLREWIEGLPFVPERIEVTLPGKLPPPKK